MKFLEPNTILDERYKILSVIGKGGSGVVYKALDFDTDQLVAVKVLTINDFDPRAKMQHQYFLREVGVLKKVSHPNIIHILNSGINKYGQPYLITDYIEGESLKSIMKKGRLSLEKIAYILQEVSQALEAIHKQRIIHRDFKPQNILISQNQTPEIVKLLDFGIAKMLRGENEEPFLQATITAKGVVIGTLQYMSPEQCQAHPLDHRTDIYSMGITAYEMLSDRLPFDNANFIGITLMHIEAPVPKLENIPKSLEAVIMKSLEKLPENRYSSAIEFSKAFSDALVEIKTSEYGLSLVNKTDSEKNTGSFFDEFSEAPTAQYQSTPKVETNQNNLLKPIQEKFKT